MGAGMDVCIDALGVRIGACIRSIHRMRSLHRYTHGVCYRYMHKEYAQVHAWGVLGDVLMGCV